MPKVVSNSSPLIQLAKIGQLNLLKHFFNEIGVLIRAKDEGKIASLGEILEKLKETGFWISDDLYTKILREGGEL